MAHHVELARRLEIRVLFGVNYLYFLSHRSGGTPVYSTVTLLARLRGLSTSVPFTRAAW